MLGTDGGQLNRLGQVRPDSPAATMNTVIVSRNSTDPLALQLRGLVHSRLVGKEPATLSYTGFDRGVHEQVDLALLVLPTDVDDGLDMLRRVRSAVSGHV